MTWERWINTVQNLDCLEGMKQMPEGVVHCVVTSPPYYGLRDYQTEGQMGLEKTPEEYVSKMVEVFREVKRIMHPTGTLWLNMGDSYWGSWGNSGSREGGQRGVNEAKYERPGWDDHTERPATSYSHPDLKPKDLLEMPSWLVLALQADGWWLRCRIPWLKRNAMPESCRDRPTQAVEYVFLLSKSKDYFYDGEAVRVKQTTPMDTKSHQTFGAPGGKAEQVYGKKHLVSGEKWKPTGRRSRRNTDWFFESWQGLWTDENGEPLAFIVNPKPYKRAHFATFPPGLVIPCLKAGTSERGACPECGSPWVRVIENTEEFKKVRDKQSAKETYKSGLLRRGSTFASGTPNNLPTRTKTLGWRPTCDCGKEPVPCLAFDPFAGTGTVIEVARKMGRSALGFEISEEYVKEYCAERLAQGVLGLHVLKNEGKG